MTRYIAILLWALWPAMLSAQPIPVQTGEHADFTRIVLRLPAGASWDLGRSDDGYLLRLPGRDGYDLTRFYDLIPRTRVAAVTQNPDSGLLRLTVTCRCQATAFVTEQGFLVIDIGDGAPDPQSPFEAALATSLLQSSTGEPAFRLPIIPSRQAPAGPLLPFPVEFPSARQQSTPPDATNPLVGLEDLVVQSLGRGLSAGILTPDLVPVAVPPRARARISQLPGMRTSDNRDRRWDGSSEPSTVADPTIGCAPDAFVNLGSWADDRPFHAQLSAMRSDLVQDIDQFDPEAVVRLARLHLHFGFGREASQILDLDGVKSQERQYILALAAVIEDLPVGFSVLDQQVNCPSAIALWAFLAAPYDDPPSDYNRTAILQTFKDLPDLMQQHLGPRLAERFTTAGDLEAAGQALAAIRLAAPDAIEAQLGAVTLATQEGDAATALQILTELVQTNSRLPPEALVLYIMKTGQLGQTVSPETMVLADAMRREFAQTPVAGDLAAAQIYAHIDAGDFEPAAQLLTDEQDALGPERFAKAVVDFGLAASKRMSDADFITFAYSVEPPDHAPLLQEALAERLIDLGFPDRALEILTPDRTGPTADNLRYLQALAYLELQEHDSALRLLQNDPSERARALAQTARAMRAGNTAALEAMAAPDTVETLWRNGDWAQLARSDDPLINDAASAILNSDAIEFDTDRPLTSGRILLDQAAQSRELLDGLFNRFAPPDEF